MGAFFMASQKNLVLKAAIVAKFDRLFLFALNQRIHPSTVTNVISGRQELNHVRKRQWAKALGRSVLELFSSEYEEE
jgi:hypothetical protein